MLRCSSSCYKLEGTLEEPYILLVLSLFDRRLERRCTSFIHAEVASCCLSIFLIFPLAKYDPRLRSTCAGGGQSVAKDYQKLRRETDKYIMIMKGLRRIG